jgi:glycerol uptake facilitator-like aquaporin
MVVRIDNLIVVAVLVVLGCNAACLLYLLALPLARGSVEAGRAVARTVRGGLAEAIGTFALMFCGLLAAAAPALAGQDRPADPLVAALGYGLAVAVLVAALGTPLGGHFNPAVTLAAAVAGRLHPLAGLVYAGCQFGGASGACWLLGHLFGLAPVEAGVPALAETVQPLTGALLEGIATFFLVLVVFGTATDNQESRLIASLAVGLTVVLGVLCLGPLTGGAFNPARYLGAAAVTRRWSDAAIYTGGPGVGAILAAAVHQLFLLAPAEVAAPAEDESAEEPERLAA